MPDAIPSPGQPAAAITVTGTGTASRPADVASITIGVSVLGASAALATAQASEAADRLHEALTDAGVDRRDLATRDYSLFPEQDHRSGQAVLRGYRVNNSVVVTVRELANMSGLLQLATEAAGDATTINGISFDLSDDSDLRRTARAAAWDDAVSAAQQLADLASARLGPAVSISEDRVSAAPAVRMRRAMVAESGPPIEGGDSSVAVSLTVSFALAT